MKRFAIVATMLLNFSASAQSAVESESRSLDFDSCLAVIRQTASELSIAPINIAETNILRVVRFPLPDGSVLITCSKPDRKMIVTKSK